MKANKDNAPRAVHTANGALSLLIPNYTGLALAAVAAKHKGFTVGALNNSGVLLVGTNLDLVQSAISFAGMISALLYGAGDAMISLLFHFNISSH